MSGSNTDSSRVVRGKFVCSGEQNKWIKLFVSREIKLVAPHFVNGSVYTYADKLK